MNVIIRFDNMKNFLDVQEILFKNKCYWFSEKISKTQCYKHFDVYESDYLLIKDNLISIIGEYEISKYDFEYFDSINLFIRNFKLKKILK